MSLNITTQLKTFIEVLSDKERQKVETEKAKSIFKNITIKKISQNSRLGEIMKEKDETKVHAEAVRFNKMIAEVYDHFQKPGSKVKGIVKGKTAAGKN